MRTATPTIAGYSQFRFIAAGGSASVYRARQDQLERFVAVKVLDPRLSDGRTRELFDVERRALGRLPKDQNIVTVFASGFTGEGDPYLVMELCQSGSLAALLKASGPLSVELCSRVGLKMARALGTSHRAGMVHRDVKPQNVLISDLGEPVLSDFGIAALVDLDTTTNDGAGTPHHYAPELLRGVAPSSVSDLYSLGSTVFTLLVGYPPHQTSASEKLNLDALYKRVGDPTWIPNVPADNDIPRELRGLLGSLLSKDPRKRIGPADEVAAAFERVERILDTDRRQLRLPTTQLPEDLFTPDAEADSEKTLMEPSVGSAQPRVDPKNPFRSLSRSASARQTRAHDQAALAEPEQNDDDDDDATVVVRKLAKSTTLQDKEGQREESITPGRGRATVRVAAALFLLAVVVLTGVRFLTRDQSSKSTVPDSAPTSTEVTAPVIILLPPTELATRRIGDAVEVSWTASPDPGVQYEVEVLRNGTTNDVVQVAQPPLLVRSAVSGDCYRVSAIDSATARVATSEPFCPSEADSNISSSVATEVGAIQ